MSGQVNLNTQRQHPSGLHISNPSSLDIKIGEYNRNATAAFQSANTFGAKVEECKALIQNINNPALSRFAYFQSFRDLVGLDICKTVCSAVSLAITKNASVEMGEQLLQENFLVILRLKDSDGRNPLDKILDQFSSEAETYRVIGEIHYLASALTSLQSSMEKTKRESLLASPLPFITSTSLHEDTIAKFNGLTNEARNTLAEQLWIIDGKPDIGNYGYKTAVEDILKLVSHKGKCITEECLSELEAKKNPSFTFSIHCVYEERILPSDHPKTIEIAQQIYYLEDLRLLLADPNKSNDFLVSKYHKMPQNLKKTLLDVRELLCKIIAVSSYRPQTDLGFGEHILNVNMQWLVKTKNKQGMTIIGQLIPHYIAKLQLSRMEKEVDDFIVINGKTVAADRRGWWNAFNPLSHQVKEGLRYKAWYYSGGKDNPRFTSDLCFGKNKIESDPFCLSQIGSSGVTILKEHLLELQSKQKDADKVLLSELERAKTLPHAPVDVSTRPLEQEAGLIDQLPENLRVAFVTAEFGPAGLGGLRPAVNGMVHAFGAEDTRVVMPLYRNGPIDEKLIESMKEADHEIWVDGRRVGVMKAKIDGIRCYFIDHPVFWIPKKEDGISSGNFYEGDYHYTRSRWAIFQKAAADLCYNFSKKRHPVQLIECQDAQTALVPKFLKEHHFEEWIKGLTPVTHFTYHNNAEPMAFEGDESVSILGRVQLPQQPLNSFIVALQDADVKSTVSLQFGKESQMPHSDFGNGLDYFVKKAAFEGNLYGVVNGNTINWDPRKDEQLRNWTSVLPGTLGLNVDLRFGPNSSAQALAQNTVRIQNELCAYLKGLHPDDPAYADLDPDKPIVMYLGRYDTRQKGINKLPLIMHEALNNGAQFVCVGLEPDKDAKHILSEMKEFAKGRKNKGILILEDTKIGKALKYQGVFGSLLRSVCFPVFPSSYEPCGLVQGELNCYGRMPIATGTGGFVDTLRTEGPNANGYLFQRCNDWNSPEQDEQIRITLVQALSDAKAVQKALHHGSIADVAPHMEKAKLIMKNALNSTWEKTPDGSLSPIVKRQLIAAKGFQRRKLRGGAGHVELKPLQL